MRGVADALLGMLVFLIVNERARAKDTRVAVNRLNARSCGRRRRSRPSWTQCSRQPANAEVLQRSQLLNTLIERKSISWTRIFADLETRDAV